MIIARGGCAGEQKWRFLSVWPSLSWLARGKDIVFCCRGVFQGSRGVGELECWLRSSERVVESG